LANFGGANVCFSDMAARGANLLGTTGLPSEVAFMLCFRTACQAGVSTKLATFEMARSSSPITFCVFSNTSSFTAAISNYIHLLQALALKRQ
jgi:hypothetical protein